LWGNEKGKERKGGGWGVIGLCGGGCGVGGVVGVPEERIFLFSPVPCRCRPPWTESVCQGKKVGIAGVERRMWEGKGGRGGYRVF